MKHSNTWFELILIASALLLSGVSSANALQNERDNRTNHDHPQQQNEAAQVQPPVLVPSPAYYAAILGELRAIVREEIAKDEQEHTDRKNWNTPSFWVSLWLAFVGTAYTVVAYRQLSVIRTQSKIQSDALSLQFRPHLIVRDVRLVGAPNAFQVDQPLEVALSIVNKGSADATIISSIFVIRVLPYGALPQRQISTPSELPEFQDGDLHYFESQLRSPIIEAGMQTVPVSKQTRLALQPHEFKQLTEGPTHAVYAIGMIFYRDSAGRFRKTGFCRKYMTAYERFFTMNDPELEYTY
jgi:hypothetical protein